MDSALHALVPPDRGRLGTFTPPAPPEPDQPTNFEQSVAAEKRKAKASVGDYAGSIWRQDGLIDGFTATLAGSGIEPVEGYSIFEDKDHASLMDGIDDSFKDGMWSATSPGQAAFIRDRILQKQEDLKRLGDLGFAGQVGRLALNVLMPDQLLLGIATGGVARGAQAFRVATAGSKLAKAERRAAQAVAAGRPGPAVAAGVTFGVAENVAYEALRQSVNFEDDNTALFEAGVLGGAFVAPFAWAGARSAKRIGRAAEDEFNVIQALRAANDGAPLTARQVELINTTHQKIEAAQDLTSGRLTEEEYFKRLEEFEAAGRALDGAAARAADEVDAEVRGRAKSIIDEFYPPTAEPTVRPTPAPPSAMPASHAEIAAANLAARPPRPAAPSATQAAPSATQAAPSDMPLSPAELAAANAANPATPGALQAALAPAQAGLAAGRAIPDAPGLSREAAFEKAEAEQAAALEKERDALLIERDLQDAGESLPPPSGFRARGSVGAAQVLPLGSVDRFSSSYTGYHTVMTLPGTNGKIKVPTRFDLYAFLNESESPLVRALGHKLIKDPVGQKDFSAQSMTASEWRSHYKRAIAGRYHLEAREALKEAYEAAGIGRFKRGPFRLAFHDTVSRLARGDDTALDALPTAAHPAVRKAAASFRKAYDKFLAEAQSSGVKGAQGVSPNDAYVNRIWRNDRIKEAMQLHGEDNVYRLIANAMTGTTARGPLTGNIAKAKSFLTVIRKLKYSHAMQSIHLAGRDMATLRQELKTANLDDDDINTLIDVMFEARAASGTDAGQAPQLKFRFDLDETIMMKTPAGELRLSDLLENDSRILMDRYANSMGGHIGMARVGYASQADFAAEMKLIEDAAMENVNTNQNRLKEEMDWLRDIQSNILGRPMSTADFSTTARLAAGFRGYTRSVMLGQLGLTSAFEMFQSIGIMGVRAFYTHIPSFGAFMRAIRDGHIADKGLARDVMHIGGWGHDRAMSYARAREIDEDFAADMLSRVEHGANVTSHAVDVISGNASFTSITRQLSAMMSVQRLFDQSSGGKALSQADLNRLSVQGLDGQMLLDVQAKLKQFTDSDKGRVTGIRYEDWHADDPDTYEAFQLYMSRQTRDAIQDHDLGETMPWMHSTLGKMFVELKTFFMVAHAKNMLKNVHHADSTTFQVYMMGALGQSLAYALQQSINDPENIAKRLDPEVMGKAVFGRMAAMGFVPMIVDTAHQLAFDGESFLMPGSTSSGSNNRSFTDTPSLMTARKLLFTAPRSAIAAATGGTVTQREFREMWQTVPGFNTYGMRGLGSYLSEMQPKSEAAP